jgi:hypothetical protein
LIEPHTSPADPTSEKHVTVESGFMIELADIAPIS